MSIPNQYVLCGKHKLIEFDDFITRLLKNGKKKNERSEKNIHPLHVTVQWINVLHRNHTTSYQCCYELVFKKIKGKKKS